MEAINNTTEATDQKLYFCVENPLFKKYLETTSAYDDEDIVFIEKEKLPELLAENQSTILVLQSDQSEIETIELSSRLKRVFGKALKIIYLSCDYKIKDDVGRIADLFLEFPISVEEILSESRKIEQSQRKILLIDDSKLVHSSIVPGLENAGFTVVQAFDGLEGLEMARKERPNLIISDIEMPRMNGYETCNNIRTDPDISDTYIIMSSTLSSASDQRKGFEVGVDEYITKPVDLEELVDKISRVLDRTNFGRESILVIEQNAKTSGVMAKSLTKQGFNVRCIRNLPEAINLTQKNNFELIISELEPSGGTILDLFNALNAVKSKANSPAVIITSSKHNVANSKMAMNAGASGYLSKPFSMDGLTALSERVLAERKEEQERAQLERYVSKASRQIALEKTILPTPEGQGRAVTKAATVFFSDIVNFTNRCENYPPKDVVNQINQIFSNVANVINKHDGDVDKFMGDACLAFWLEKNLQEMGNRAISTIYEVNQKLADLNSSDEAFMKDPVHLRMGVNFGDVILCDIGADESRLELTIISDAVNIAARLEGACRVYGVNNLVTLNILENYKEEFIYREIDSIVVKGKQNSISCGEILAFGPEILDAHHTLKGEYEEGLAEYRKGNFSLARDKFQNAETLEVLQPSAKNTPSEIMISRCADLMLHEPESWDGIWTLSTK